MESQQANTFHLQHISEIRKTINDEKRKRTHLSKKYHTGVKAVTIVDNVLTGFTMVLEESAVCHICKKPFQAREEKVRDHCHLTGKFRGAAHKLCNLNYKDPKFFPVIFHNLSGYDSHLFIKHLWKTEGDIDCIADNEEKYISFSKEVVVGKYTDEKGVERDVTMELRFLDSFRFMPPSMDKLSKNLQREQFINLKKYFGDEKNFDLVRRKGVFPYDYVDGLEKLKEQKLPPKEAFYSRLNDEDISDEDYSHTQML